MMRPGGEMGRVEETSERVGPSVGDEGSRAV